MATSPTAAEWRRSSSIAAQSSRPQRHRSHRHLIARSQARNLSGAIGDALNQVEGAYFFSC